ncbi:thioredoxin family protein [Paraliobacillus sediminis]|nr:thioredoxin family protein [Paraliobacillus sediminis]
MEKVTDFKEIANYGVMTTPALVVDGEVKVYGKVAKAEEIKTYLQ